MVYDVHKHLSICITEVSFLAPYCHQDWKDVPLLPGLPKGNVCLSFTNTWCAIPDSAFKLSKCNWSGGSAEGRLLTLWTQWHGAVEQHLCRMLFRGQWPGVPSCSPLTRLFLKLNSHLINTTNVNVCVCISERTQAAGGKIAKSRSNIRSTSRHTLKGRVELSTL